MTESSTIIKTIANGIHEGKFDHYLIHCLDPTVKVTLLKLGRGFAKYHIERGNRIVEVWIENQSNPPLIKLSFYRRHGERQHRESIGSICSISSAFGKMAGLVERYLEDTRDEDDSPFEFTTRKSVFWLIKDLIAEPKPKPYIPRHLRDTVVTQRGANYLFKVLYSTPAQVAAQPNIGDRVSWSNDGSNSILVSTDDTGLQQVDVFATDALKALMVFSAFEKYAGCVVSHVFLQSSMTQEQYLIDFPDQKPVE